MLTGRDSIRESVGVGRRNGQSDRWVRTPPRKIRSRFRGPSIHRLTPKGHLRIRAYHRRADRPHPDHRGPALGARIARDGRRGGGEGRQVPVRCPRTAGGRTAASVVAQGVRRLGVRLCSVHAGEEGQRQLQEKGRPHEASILAIVGYIIKAVCSPRSTTTRWPSSCPTAILPRRSSTDVMTAIGNEEIKVAVTKR